VAEQGTPGVNFTQQHIQGTLRTINHITSKEGAQYHTTIQLSEQSAQTNPFMNKKESKANKEVNPKTQRRKKQMCFEKT
jgi:hypothetical protein